MLRSRFFQILIIIIGVGLIVNLSRSVLKLLQASDQLREAEQKVSQLEKEASLLAQKKDLFQSPDFIEQEARNKLNMVKEGETVVVLPANIEEFSKEKERQKSEPLPNWRQWLNLFL
jgi:cell division protein FtsB